MAHRFSLDTVLRLRQIAEEREERLLSRILREIAELRQQLADLETQRGNLLAVREADLRARTSAMNLHLATSNLAALDDLEAKGRQQMAQLELLRVEQMKRFELAHRDHELLAGMRDEEKAQFLVRQTKEQQKAMDDNFAARRKFR